MGNSQNALPIRLIVGLGNPGTEYTNTRHNAGFWLVDLLAESYATNIQFSGKFFGEVAKFKYKNHDILLLKPSTFMNLSGKSVLAVANFYKINVGEILVIHDELDFTPGLVRLKFAGGNGGHNGLRDIDRVLGRDYWRVRIGIGHPGHKNAVHDYVLKKPAADDRVAINNAMNKVVDNMQLILDGDFATALKTIHTLSI
jgi:PTH1 family peptidyl-tRNA hydrolase